MSRTSATGRRHDHENPGAAGLLKAPAPGGTLAAAIARRFHAEVILMHVVRDDSRSTEVLEAWDLLDDSVLQSHFVGSPANGSSSRAIRRT
jgi:hypothetical protein